MQVTNSSSHAQVIQLPCRQPHRPDMPIGLGRWSKQRRVHSFGLRIAECHSRYAGMSIGLGELQERRMVQTFWRKTIVWRCPDCSREQISEFHHTNEKTCAEMEYAMVCRNRSGHMDNNAAVGMHIVEGCLDEVYVTDPRDVSLINKQAFVANSRAFTTRNHFHY